MEPALGSNDELWLRQGWLTRLRWLVGPAVLAMSYGMELARRQPLFPKRPIFALLAALLTINAGYVTLLHRWAKDPATHARPLHLLAHTQVVIDFVVWAAVGHYTGGPQSPFWTFPALTVTAATLFFGPGWTVYVYTALPVALWWTVCMLDGAGPLALQPMLLACFVSMVTVICTFYARRMTESRRLAQSKDQILSRVSHELRTPLSALRGFVYLAKKRAKARDDLDATTNAQLGQTLQRIDAQVDRLARMVSDLYDVSSVQAGKLKLEPRACDLIGIVREVALRFRTLHPHLELRWTGPDAMWGNWDALRLDQLLSNLVGNAVKYAGEGSVIEVTVTPAAGGSAHITVHDEGPGIPADKLAVIFEPFQRIDESGQQKGLGLGLAIAREIALLHGGAIWVDSQVGRGTTFHVRLPTGGVRPPH